MQITLGSTNQISQPLLYRFIYDVINFDVADLCQDIKQNLQCILNSRSLGLVISDEQHEIKQSILNYGVDDFTHSYFGNKQSQEQLCRNIVAVINAFEKRLSKVEIAIIENDMALERKLKIRISGDVLLKPTIVPVTFESSLDITKQTFTLEEQ